MKILRLLGLLSLISITADAQAPTSVQWGAQRTVSPWNVGVFDNTNIFQALFTVAPTGGAMTLSSSVTTALGLTGVSALSVGSTTTGFNIGAGTTFSSGLTYPGAIVTGSFTATGLVTNDDLVNTGWVLNSTPMILGGGPYTITASPPVVGNLTEATSSVLTITGGTGAVIGTGTALQVKLAGTSQSGYLSSTDWNTFNGKQAAGSYITALTGDATASGPGSSAITFATVNSNTGTFGSTSAIPNFTVNAKGLVTAAGTNTIAAPLSGITGLGANVSTALGNPVNSAGGLATSASATLSGNILITGIHTNMMELGGQLVSGTGSAGGNTTAINNDIQTLGALGGGTINLPCGAWYINNILLNNVSGVTLKGCGYPHYYFSSTGGYQTLGNETRILAIPGYSQTTMATLVSPTGSSNVKLTGGGFQDIAFDANNVAPNALTINSRDNAEVDIATYNISGSGYAVEIASCISGTDLASTCDTQHGNIHLQMYQESGSGNGLQLNGSSNANASRNSIWAQYIGPGTGTPSSATNIAIDCHNADGNTFQMVEVFGTTTAFLAEITTSAGDIGCQGNILNYVVCPNCSSNGIYAFGAATTPSPGVDGFPTNTIGFLNTGNGTPFPNGDTTGGISASPLWKIISSDPNNVTALAKAPPCSSLYIGQDWTITNGAASPTWGATASGSGSAITGIFCDGTNWTVAAK